jgi:hypothetical protein
MRSISTTAWKSTMPMMERSITAKGKRRLEKAVAERIW